MHQLLPLVKSLQETPYQCTYWTMSFLPHQSDRQVELVIVPLVIYLTRPSRYSKILQQKIPPFLTFSNIFWHVWYIKKNIWVKPGGLNNFVSTKTNVSTRLHIWLSRLLQRNVKTTWCQSSNCCNKLLDIGIKLSEH